MADKMSRDARLQRLVAAMKSQSIGYQNALEELEEIAALSGGGWMPIESAPKDGTKIDQWTAGGRRLTNVYWHVGTYGSHWSDCYHRDPPTHWRYLPPPPKDGA